MKTLSISVQQISNGYLLTTSTYGSGDDYSYEAPTQTYVATKSDVEKAVADAVVAMND
jgi:hypothetical protein